MALPDGIFTLTQKLKKWEIMLNNFHYFLGGVLNQIDVFNVEAQSSYIQHLPAVRKGGRANGGWGSAFTDLYKATFEYGTKRFYLLMYDLAHFKSYLMELKNQFIKIIAQ